jgi:hypothetical protein
MLQQQGVALSVGSALLCARQYFRSQRLNQRNSFFNQGKEEFRIEGKSTGFGSSAREWAQLSLRNAQLST